MMVVDIHAHELTDAARAPKLTERRDEVRRVSREADDGSIHVHHIRVRAVDL